MEGFFTQEEVACNSVLLSRKTLAGCGACKLHKSCRSPKMPLTGKGALGILIVAEAPGREEDLRNTQLIGEAGQLLRRTLKGFSLDLDRDFWKMNAISCRPPENRTPKDFEIAACRANVFNAIRKYQPKMIWLMGGSALNSVIGGVYQDDDGLGGITKWRGYNIPDQELKTWVSPMYHPSYILRGNSEEVTGLIFKKDIAQALKYLGKPLPAKPNTSQVDILTDPRKYLRWLLEKKPAITFDYETTGKKPYRKGHDIICCSVSDRIGHAKVFEMKENIRPLWAQVLEDTDIRKSAHNMKYEDIWSRVILRAKVRGWYYDSMLGAHWIDNRSGITGLKFQAYVHWGIKGYDNQVKKFIGSSGAETKKYGANGFNELKKAPIRSTLLYCGMDSLLERMLEEKQLRRLKKYAATDFTGRV